MDGFRKFLLRGNVVDLAVGIVIGSAFALVVSSFVEAFLTPLIGLVTGVTGSFAEAAAVVGSGGSAVTFPYGQFIQALISFVLVAAAVYFLVVRPVNTLMDRYATEPEVTAETTTCTDCLSNIPSEATRCAFCGVEQPRERQPSRG